MKQISLFFAFLSFSIILIANNLPDSSDVETHDSLKLVLLDIPAAAHIDSAIICYYEDLFELTTNVNSVEDLTPPDSTPMVSSEVYIQRLNELTKTTPFNLSYNTVVEAFIHLYVSKRRQLSENCLGRGEQYFPMIEEMLDRYNLPLEIKYLAVVESALDPTARSKAGAVGLWQFMYGTGKNFGLHIDSYIDERNDPLASTEAACKYLTYLYNMFGDWNLALAAYNCGEGRVAKAIRRSGGKKDYWEIYPYLPRETRGYVPAFIAVNYLFAYSDLHQLKAVEPAYKAYEIDSIHIHQQLSFSQISDLLSIDESVIKFLNPIYRLNTVPAYKHFNVVYLPKDKANVWVANQDTLTHIIKESATAVVSEPTQTPIKEEIYYTVRSGDYLGRIATRNGVSVSQLQQWNNLSSTNLKVGQKLVIYQNHSSSKSETNLTTAKTKSINEYYTIKSGDTLWDIAKSRGVSVDDLKRWNTHISVSKLKPGMKIVVGKA